MTGIEKYWEALIDIHRQFGIDRGSPDDNNYRPQSEGDNALGSVRLSVRPFVCALTLEPFESLPVKRCMCVSNQ